MRVGGLTPRHRRFTRGISRYSLYGWLVGTRLVWTGMDKLRFLADAGVRTSDRRDRSGLHFTMCVMKYVTRKEIALCAIKRVPMVTFVLSVEILLFVYSRQFEQMNINTSD